MLCLLFVHVCCMLGWGAWWWVWSIVVTPTHPLVPWHPGGGKLCRCYSATLHNLLQRHHSATLQTSGGWVGPGGCRGVLSMWTTSTPAPTHPDGTIHSTARPRQRRAAPCTARPATRRGAQLRTARLEGLNFRGMQMQTRGNFLPEQRKLWKVVESFPLKPAAGVGEESSPNLGGCGE